MRPRRGTLSLPVNGELMQVPDVPHLHCPACGENVLTMEQAGILEAGALAFYRSRHHLLTADEIRALRERLGLTQAALAKLLRLLRERPGSLAYLKRHAA